MAMLALAAATRPGEIEVATVNHGLRPEAADECALVLAACEARDISCTVLTVEVGAGNLQTEAREGRYRALLAWASDRGLQAVATAHHADDQAETVLMRLMRGSGLQGLAGIRPQVVFENTDIPVIRPLLGFRRDELREVIAETGMPFASDPSNEDESFDRVRMRKAIADADWLDPVAITRSAGHLSEAESTLEALADQFWRKRSDAGEGEVTVPMTDFNDSNARLIVRAATSLGASVRLGDVIALLGNEMAQRGKANIAGVLIEQVGQTYRIRREPPRNTG
ncbi:tRNA lysidine(34) synthetase TilS [Erythrobacter jejuensis]|uniref:tRNA(Ile)-lysidine synthase n=2 Tax=Parerythrobacter jejuensis TaxID=795812 RepID=A0A845APW4_9SPHN|nr:tRNA lysidine(34) synthetase TilS [Parerythrobacter jejuensis]